MLNLGNVTANGTVVTSNAVGWTEVELYGAHLRYPLFNDGSILGLNNAPAIAEKKAKKQALAWTVNLTREEVIYRIIDEFVTTVSARNRMGLAERRVKLLDQSVSITQEQQKQGLKLPIDVKVAKATVPRSADSSEASSRASHGRVAGAVKNSWLVVFIQPFLIKHAP